MSDTAVEIEDSNIDEINIDDDISNDKPQLPHNDKPITKIEISPNEEYLVTYSRYDHSIVGWNIKDECPFEPELPVKLDSDKRLSQIFVSNDKKLAYIDYNE